MLREEKQLLIDEIFAKKKIILELSKELRDIKNRNTNLSKQIETKAEQENKIKDSSSKTVVTRNLRKKKETKETAPICK